MLSHTAAALRTGGSSPPASSTAARASASSRPSSSNGGGEEVTIRQFRPGDEEAVVAIFKRGFMEYLTEEYFPAEGLAERRLARAAELERQCSDPDDMGDIMGAYVAPGGKGNFFVATLGEEVVGCVGAIVRSPDSVREKRKQDHLPASWAPLGVPELEEPGVVRPLTPAPDPHSSAAGG